MSSYNESTANLKCPRCNAVVDIDIQWHFGFTSRMLKLSIGDKYPWNGNRAVHNGGRPEGGNLDGEGYTVCPSCKNDFWVKAIVRNDILKYIEVDFEKEPYTP